MAFNWHKFPWTNLHELNLDWIIQTVKTLENNLADAVGKFTEIVNTAVSAERTERIAADAEIEAEIVTGVYPAINKSITDTLTGSGDLSINKDGAVNISGNGVKIEDKRTGGLIQILKGFAIGCTGTFAEIVNTTASKTLILAYNGIFQVHDNNDKPVVISGVSTVDKAQIAAEARQNLAASCGYVDGEIGAVNEAITAETNARNTGDAALQSAIDNVIMPLLTKVEKRAPRVIYALIGDASQGTDTLTAEQIESIKTALLEHTPIMLCIDSSGDGAQFFYHLDNCSPAPDSGNINSALSLTFKTVSGIRTATLDLSTKTIDFS